MNKLEILFRNFVDRYINSENILIYIVSFSLLYIVLTISMNIITKKKYKKISISNFIPIIHFYKVGLYAYNGYVGLLLIFMPFFVSISRYYVSDIFYRIFYFAYFIFSLTCFIKLIIETYNISIKNTIKYFKSFIEDNFKITITHDEKNDEEVIKIEELNEVVEYEENKEEDESELI